MSHYSNKSTHKGGASRKFSRLAFIWLNEDEAIGVLRIVGWVAAGMPIPPEDKALALRLERRGGKVLFDQYERALQEAAVRDRGEWAKPDNDSRNSSEAQ